MRFGVRRFDPSWIQRLEGMRASVGKALPRHPNNRRRASSSSASSRPLRSTEQIKEDHEYCVKLVHDRDREGWLCGLLLPATVQPAYFALRAFNAELASIQDPGRSGRSGAFGQDQKAPIEYSTSLAWQIRMRWWRNTIAAIYADDNDDDALSAPEQDQQRRLHALQSSDKFRDVMPPSSVWQSPVVRQLDVAARAHGWTRRWLDRILDARQDDLGRQQFATLQQAVEYADETVSSSLLLTLETLLRPELSGDVKGLGEIEAATDECLSYAGVGIGLTTLLRATPVRLLIGECPLPAECFPSAYPYNDLLLEATRRMQLEGDGNDQGDTQALSEADAAIFRDTVQAVAQEASLNLHQARELQIHVPKQARLCLLPVVPATIYLERLEAAGYDVFDPRAIHDATRLRLLLLLARTWMTKVL